MSITQLQTLNFIFEKFFPKSIASLSQVENIITDEVKSFFKSEDELFDFIKELLLKFFHIACLNSYVVSIFFFL